MSALRAFARAPLRRKLLAVEALAELTRARCLTLFPARRYVRALGDMDQASGGTIDEAQGNLAAEIGAMVGMVGAVAPFRARCLQQAIAVRRMLRRRNVPASVFLGVSLDRVDRATPDLGRAAHAWVKVGSRVVSGAGDLDRMAIVARFT